MGAVRIRPDKKYHNNAQVIHTAPDHQLTPCKAESSVCVFFLETNLVFNYKPLLLAKIRKAKKCIQ